MHNNHSDTVLLKNSNRLGLFLRFFYYPVLLLIFWFVALHKCMVYTILIQKNPQILCIEYVLSIFPTHSPNGYIAV